MSYIKKRCLSLYRRYSANSTHYNIHFALLGVGFLVRLAWLTALPGGLN